MEFPHDDKTSLFCFFYFTKKIEKMLENMANLFIF
ncbi:hypothetical protein SSU05_1552 [Streptococcus suis 05ZYH33]|nr:hypothetical protein SSU05_1552 [Streptococcus suis 05ZYH33]